MWIARNYNKIINSIAFYPALIAITFLAISYLGVSFDFSETGKQIKTNIKWFSLKDATTARSIISSIVSGIISLAVFSFSMVMIVLNQTASQMSNRILDKLIGNRFQQIVLGIYIGTIVFALFLLSTIRDIDSGIHIPSISTYFLIVLTIFDIFLFIYFLHYITQSVKYNFIIHQIAKETSSQMKDTCKLEREPPQNILSANTYPVRAKGSGIYEGFNNKSLLKICDEHDCTMHLLKPRGSFVMEGSVVMNVSKELPDHIQETVEKALFIHENESIGNNFFYGMKQLMEVAIKALSPGINDPGTAVESLRALTKLLAYRLSHFPNNAITNNEKQVKIITTQITFEEMFTICILPIWDYGKEDRMIQLEMLNMLQHLRSITPSVIVNKLLKVVRLAVQKKAL